MKRQTERLRILHLLLTLGETSAGYNEHCLALAGQRDITICTLFRPMVICPNELTVFSGQDSIIGFLRSLSEALKGRKYDILHAHSVHVAFLLLALRLLRPWQSLPPTVFTMHTSFPNYKFRNKLLLIPVWIFFNRLVCCSQASYSSLPRFFKVLAGNRLRIVPNGVDTKRINRVIGDQPRKPSSRPFTVIAVGRLIKVKNPLSILRAFQQSADPHSRLIFVGEGDLRPALIASNQSNGTAKQVEFSGLISRNQVYERLTGADVFISASFIEGLPVSVLEAMVCGCPVILSDIPPHREIAKGFDCIPLIPPHDTSRLAQEIKRFRSMSAVERANIGHQCRKLAEERFSLNRMHDQYDEIYTGLFAK